MYENFGPSVQGNTVTFRVFFPDNSKDPSQYVRGGLPRIKTMHLVGDFQSKLGQPNWTPANAPEMVLKSHPKGLLYECQLTLSNGFYQYKYYVTFDNEDEEPRWVNDPCAKYSRRDTGIPGNENSAFVVGGNLVGQVNPITTRLPQQDLIIYEMMVDDFVNKLQENAPDREQKAPLDFVKDQVDYLDRLGINAVEFMPLTATLGEGFSWGYDPFLFFAIEDRFVHAVDPDEQESLDKLFRLKQLIEALHEKEIHVIFDGVFNHTVKGSKSFGFPYYWFYQYPPESPFIGAFERGGFFEELDFQNRCTQEFIFDVCRYWFDRFQIDGIRFDYTLGYFNPSGLDPGLTRLLRNLDGYLGGTGRKNIALMIEHLTDNRYEAINVANQVGATGCWFDPLAFKTWEFGPRNDINTTLMPLTLRFSTTMTWLSSVSFLLNLCRKS